jgi:hypothetical protein
VASVGGLCHIRRERTDMHTLAVKPDGHALYFVNDGDNTLDLFF